MLALEAVDTLSIRSKLTLLVVGLLVPLLGLAGLTGVALIEELLLEEMEHRGRSLLAALAVPCSISLASHEIERLDDFLAQFRGPDEQPYVPPDGRGGGTDPIRDLVELCVVNPGGRVLAHTRETEYGRVLDDAFTRRAMASPRAQIERRRGPGGEPRLVLSYPVRSGLRWGTLLAHFSLQPLQDRLGRLRWQLLSLTLLLMGVTGLALAGGLQRLVVRPVRLLSTTAERIGAGDLDQRVPERGGHDELATLARVFNATAAELAAYTRNLEAKVAERSQEIVDKNQALELANQQLSEANARLEQVATTDGLTGLANKSHLLNRLQFEVLRAHRGDHRLGLLMLDVDHFKHFNDTHGHLAGDHLLAGLAELLRANLRSIDIIGRFGGEEFCVALLDTGLRQAVKAAEKLRRSVERRDFEGGGEQPGGRLTVSIGVAELATGRDEDAAALLERADRALYRAKAGGRNRVEAAG